MQLNAAVKSVGIEVLVPSTAITATAAGTAKSGYQDAESLLIQVDVTTVTGTNPTLDLIIQDSVDGSNWFTIATFTQITAAAHAIQRVNMTTTPIGNTIRASYTIGGTSTPTFTFSVTAYAKAKATY